VRVGLVITGLVGKRVSGVLLLPGGQVLLTQVPLRVDRQLRPS
jgi:hypothetical protein